MTGVAEISTAHTPAPHRPADATSPAIGFPGAVGISALSVYRTAAGDGHAGGSPHVHLVCSEAYYVVGGRGLVQTLTASGFRETPLQAGVVVQFGPGTIHRLVNQGNLEILVIMQNSGLPESGDAILTLAPELLRDRDEYDRVTTLPPGAQAEAAAIRRRDLAVDGFLTLVDEYHRRGPEALQPFYAAATGLTAPLRESWRRRWLEGAHRSAAATGEQLDALAGGDHSYLDAADVRVVPGPVETGRLGMCGNLDVYPSVPRD
jgi:mannose-6-phosphate isomerase-like protein (cupin superfamily)